MSTKIQCLYHELRYSGYASLCPRPHVSLGKCCSGQSGDLAASMVRRGQRGTAAVTWGQTSSFSKRHACCQGSPFCSAGIKGRGTAACTTEDLATGQGGGWGHLRPPSDPAPGAAHSAALLTCPWPAPPWGPLDLGQWRNHLQLCRGGHWVASRMEATKRDCPLWGCPLSPWKPGHTGATSFQILRAPRAERAALEGWYHCRGVRPRWL